MRRDFLSFWLVAVAGALVRDHAGPSAGVGLLHSNQRQQAMQFLRADAVHLASALSKDLDAHMGYTSQLFDAARSRLRDQADRIGKRDKSAAALLRGYAKHAPAYALVWPWPMMARTGPEPADDKTHTSMSSSSMSTEVVSRADNKGHTIMRSIRCENGHCEKTTRTGTSEDGEETTEEVDDEEMNNFGGLFKTVADGWAKGAEQWAKGAEKWAKGVEEFQAGLEKGMKEESKEPSTEVEQKEESKEPSTEVEQKKLATDKSDDMTNENLFDGMGKVMAKAGQEFAKGMKEFETELENSMTESNDKKLSTDKSAEDTEDENEDDTSLEQVAEQFAHQMKNIENGDGLKPLQQMLKGLFGTFGEDHDGDEDEIPDLTKAIKDFATAAVDETGTGKAPMQTKGSVQFKKCKDGKCVVTTRKVTGGTDKDDEAEIKNLMKDVPPQMSGWPFGGDDDMFGNPFRDLFGDAFGGSSGWPFGDGLSGEDVEQSVVSDDAKAHSMQEIMKALKKASEDRKTMQPIEEKVDLVPF